MQDLWEECFDPKLNVAPQAFSSQFCSRCTQPACSRSLTSRSRWMGRILTQEDRLLDNPKFADTKDPKFRELAGMDFKNMLRQALAIEISSRANDWTIPTEDQIAREAAKVVEATRPPLVIPDPPAPTPEPSKVEQFIVAGSNRASYTVSKDGDKWDCTCPAYKFSRETPQTCKHITDVQGLTKPAPADPPAPTTPLPARFMQVQAPAVQPRANVPMPPGGLMVDGTPGAPQVRSPVQTPAQPAPVANPWALPASAQPPARGTVVPVGAKVTMGKK